VPLVASWFFYYAGWATSSTHAGLGNANADQVPLGVAGQIIPWNFPLLMLAWKIAPGARRRQHGGAQARRDHAADGAALRRDLQQADLPPGVVNIVTGAGATGRRSSRTPMSTRSPSPARPTSARHRAGGHRGTNKKLTLELGGKAPFIVFDDADIDQAVEGIVERHLLQPGPRLLRRLAAAGAGVDPRRGHRPAEAPHATCAWATARQEHRHRRDQLRSSSSASASWSDIGEAEGASAGPGADCAIAAEAQLLVPADDLHRRRSPHRPSPRRSSARCWVLTFRTPDEAIAKANNTPYGLAASVWSETIGLALGIAPQLQAGVVWVNATNLFDAGVGFGGYRESGYGREGGREGCYEYLKPRAWAERKPRTAAVAANAANEAPKTPAKPSSVLPPIDRTAKLFVGGKQVRPDGELSHPVFAANGQRVGEVGTGNRKDIRNAVAAARSAAGWSSATPHRRAQALYYLAENLAARADEFAGRIASLTGVGAPAAEAEVDASVSRLFAYGAWADKYEGTVHVPPLRGVALATVEAMGVVGVVCPDEAPLLSFVSLFAPLMAMGNRTVIVPSEKHPLVATDFYQVLETSDLPAGVINLVTGPAASLVQTLAEHDDVDALWVFGAKAISRNAERLSVGNLKRTLVDHGLATDWHDAASAEGALFLRHATQVKNIWIPYGE
jgi:aldehyde dehydrogenase (NAD+)